jgi:uncharacterized membrane protein YdcZ (DUF606 family)
MIRLPGVLLWPISAGVLLSVDNYYNLQASRAYYHETVFAEWFSHLVVHHGLPIPQLADTEEWIDGECAGNLGEVLIR